MTRKLILYIFINICLITSYAQSITVNPEVICAGENAYLATDTNVNYVHIGDILCFLDDDTANYIIVRPEAWSQYRNAGYTPLSVVFYVDTTGKHGWAVGNVFFEGIMAGVWGWDDDEEEGSNYDFDSLYNYPNSRSAIGDFSGQANTQCISHRQQYLEDEGEYLYPIVSSIEDPFYLPSIGQLNFLYIYHSVVNDILENQLENPLPLPSIDEDGGEIPWGSSTEKNGNCIYGVNDKGMITIYWKNFFYEDESVILPYNFYVIPVMDF